MTTAPPLISLGVSMFALVELAAIRAATRAGSMVSNESVRGTSFEAPVEEPSVHHKLVCHEKLRSCQP